MRHIVMTMVLAVAPALGNAQGNDLDAGCREGPAGVVCSRIRPPSLPTAPVC